MARLAASMLRKVSGDVGSYDKAGKLPGKKIERDQRNHHQQKNRNHADKNIGNDQPVPQPPQQLRAQPAEPGNREQHNRQHAEKSYPAPQARR